MSLTTQQKQCLKQLKSFVKNRKNQFREPQQKLQIEQILFKEFFALLRSKQPSPELEKQIGNIQRVLQDQSHSKKVLPNITIKRGRPIKNLQTQMRLVQWMLSQEKTIFNKQQLEEKYCELKGSILEKIPLKDFRLILSRFQLNNIQLVGNSKKKRQNQKGTRKEECLHGQEDSFEKVEEINLGDSSFFKFSGSESPRQNNFQVYIASLDQFLENGNSRQFDFI